MTPQIDFVTSTIREMHGFSNYNPKKYYEKKWSEIDRSRRLFSTTRLGFAWLGIYSQGDPDFYSVAKSDIKQIEGPLIFAAFGKKASKWIRLTQELGGGKDKIWRKWTAAGISSVGKGCQTALYTSQTAGWGSLGFVIDLIIASCSFLTSLLDTTSLTNRYIEIFSKDNFFERKNYLLIKLIHAVLGLVCALFALIGLFFLFLQPVAPLTLTILGTTCFFLNVIKYFFKKEEVESISKFDYNYCVSRGIYDYRSPFAVSP